MACIFGPTPLLAEVPCIRTDLYSYGGQGSPPEVGAMMPGEGESPGHADSPDGIQLVGVAQTLCLECLRMRFCAEAMCFDAMNDCLDEVRILAVQQSASTASPAR